MKAQRARMVERNTENAKVAGSNPVLSTQKKHNEKTKIASSQVQ